MMLMVVVDFLTKNFQLHFSTNHQPIKEAQVLDQANHKAVVVAETQKLSLSNLKTSLLQEELEV